MRIATGVPCSHQRFLAEPEAGAGRLRNRRGHGRQPPPATAAPKVRKLAADLAVDPGRNGPPRRRASSAARRRAAAGAQPEAVPVHGVRARMAAQMVLSRSKIPTPTPACRWTGAALLRLRDGSGHPVRPDVAARGAQPETAPVLNASWEETEDGPRIRMHPHPTGFRRGHRTGLVVPVIDDAQVRTTRELAAIVDDLVIGARAGTLAPAQLGNSTSRCPTSVPWAGRGRTRHQLPEAAILGMGSLKPRAVVVDDAVVARPTMTLTCAFDHRIADGAGGRLSPICAGSSSRRRPHCLDL